MELVIEPSPSGRSLPPSAASPRLHPGERPVWIDASPWKEWWPSWRLQAEKRRVPVDAIVSIALEFCLIKDEMRLAGRGGALADLDESAQRELTQARLAPSDELREWIDRLSGRSTLPLRRDELPELVLPQRITQMPRWRPILDEAATLETLDSAVRTEVTASRHGLTVEGWVLRRALTA